MCWWGELRSWFHIRSTVICFRLSMSSPPAFCRWRLGRFPVSRLVHANCTTRSCNMAFPILRALHGARRWVDHPEVLGHQTAGGLVGWWNSLGWFYCGELPSIPMMKQLHSSILLSSPTIRIKTIWFPLGVGCEEGLELWTPRWPFDVRVEPWGSCALFPGVAGELLHDACGGLLSLEKHGGLMGA